MDLDKEDVVEQFVLEHIKREFFIPRSKHRVSG